MLSPRSRDTQDGVGVGPGSADYPTNLAQARPAPYRRTVSRSTVVTPYLKYIRQRAGEVAYNAYRIFHDLQERGYLGGYEMVKLAVRPLRAVRVQVFVMVLGYSRRLYVEFPMTNNWPR